MTIESFLLAKNRDQFDNLIKFLRSIIVKNEVEAREVETAETLDAYNLYESAYLRTDSAISYRWSVDDMIQHGGYTRNMAEYYCSDQRLIQTAAYEGDPQAKAFVEYLRNVRVSEYTENNPYYRQFCGLPYDSSQYIKVHNDDSPEISEVIYLHEVSNAKYPKTYSRLFYDRDVDKIYEDFDYMYLQFIEKPLNPYKIRNMGQFEIVYYNSTYLSDSELAYWFEAYELARNEILNIDYIEAFEDSYKAYVNVMYMYILCYAFNIYCSKLLEKYAVRDYTETEIYDILDSNNLSNLKPLNLTLLKRVIENLPDLMHYTGTDRAIDVIFDIVADSTLSVKRYYLKKKYSTNAEGKTYLDKTQLYDKNVDIVFQEKTIKANSNSLDSSEQEYSYESIVQSDDTWGGVGDINSEEEKAAVKEEIKKEILKSDFSMVVTKYISLSKVINMEKIISDTSHKLGLLYQYLKESNDKMLNDTVVFDNIEATPLAIYAAWCISYGRLHGLSDPDHIPLDTTMIEGIMKLRTTDKLSSEVLNVKNIIIDLGKDTFKETFDCTNNTSKDITLKELIEMYDSKMKARHPRFVKYSLQKNELNPIEYTAQPMAWIGDITNELFAWDGVQTLEDGTSNPNYGKLFQYKAELANIIASSGTVKVTTMAKPTWYYSILENIPDGSYGYDDRVLSAYNLISTYTDSNGREKEVTFRYEYNLNSDKAVLVSANITKHDEDFDETDEGIIINSKRVNEANRNQYKLYVRENGQWVDFVNPWIETGMYVDPESFEIWVPSGTTVVVYPVYSYANTVGDYLTDEEITKYLVKFKNLESMTTIQDLYDQYEENYEILEAIKEKIKESYSYDEYELWNTMYNANLQYQTLNELFGGVENYSDYILSVSRELYDHIESLFENVNSTAELKELNERFYTTFNNYMQKVSNNNAEVFVDENHITEGEDLSDLQTLFNQFISIFTELYKSDYRISYDNAEENVLELLYAVAKSESHDEDYTVLELREKLTKDYMYLGVCTSELILEEYIIDIIHTVIDEYIELEDELVKDVLLDRYSEFLILEENKISEILKHSSEESLELRDELLEDKIR